MLGTSQNPAATILVVDDNEANRSLARHTLEDEGYGVVTANGGVEAIAAFERARPDCVLLDVRMPDVDGFAVCESIRALPDGVDTPVVFVTALRDVETFDRALRAGGDDFLTKPVRPTELVVRVQTALKLRRTRAELREHYGLLKKQRDDLQRLQLQKERLTAFIVHDLKTPVSSMDLQAQLLLRGQGADAETRRAAAQIRSAARQLNRMILNLLDLSKADEGRLVPRRVDIDLHRLVDALTDDFEAAAGEHRVMLSATLDTGGLRADEDLLRRTLANLIDNAIRHAPPGSEITVTSVLREGATEIRVADAGAGVPHEMRERIFEPFVQIEGADRPTTRAGQGLGLTFCKVAVEAHKGRIWIEDAASGATFAMRIPNGDP
ncbi:MAG: hybrid sensor histidine kinase/response regulator [Myxococcota bacterium]|nr:hybrid sensor histidine kinase/response regulator [Myxococcota bacterium]